MPKHSDHYNSEVARISGQNSRMWNERDIETTSTPSGSANNSEAPSSSCVVM